MSHRITLAPPATRHAAGVALFVLLGGVALGCASKDAAGDKVAVTATATECVVSETSLPSGTTTFQVTNKGTDVTEVYVYGEGDKVMGEVENVGSNTSRDFTVDLGAGDYEVACKPGQVGDGIRTAITVSGTATTEATADRAVVFDGFDYSYSGLGDLAVQEGETIEFAMTNTATDTEHEFEVFGPDGEVLGEIGPTKPGATGTVTLTLAEPGTYTYVCGIDDHEERGMTGKFTVAGTSGT